MTKLTVLAIAPLAALLSVPYASAQQCAGHCSQCQVSGGATHGEQFKATYHDNHMWPSQYVQPSRRGICQSFDLMVANGWRRHNLLGKYDFTTEGEGGLTEAGKLRVKWILTQAPPSRRTIFVERGLDEAATAERIEAVQSLASEMSPGVGVIDVQDTHLRDLDRPAAGVDAVLTGFSANQLLPVLPESSGSSGSGTSE